MNKQKVTETTKSKQQQSQDIEMHISQAFELFSFRLEMSLSKMKSIISGPPHISLCIVTKLGADKRRR